MAEIILVVGGSRSGKSDYAQRRGEAINGRRCFIATCTPLDQEMEERVTRHRDGRDPQRWITVEEPLRLAAIVELHPGYDVYLIDCLTLWISNLLHHRPQATSGELEALVMEVTDELLARLSVASGSAVLVSGEVGLGIVPENRLARLYRDLVGRCNQRVAARADEVVLVSCGLPLYLKPNKREP
ncbi:MAG: bifunctional adenosylcobinamide kinase/adenosylcobinamide-phosphate guanylyltransferase [Desulfofustis sp.]|nr:bifunctional adenosylcobinamide kinase/adenosylcobinamide-phosphate guanylyltransferase [Desulfofustis sp.]